MKKRKKLHFSTVFLMLLLIAFGWWINNHTLSINTSEVRSGLINDEITIVQLSDLHGAVFGNDNEILLSRILAQSPDIIAVTGDMFTRDSETGRETALELLAALADKYPVYYVNGEHDDDEAFFSLLRDNGVNVLNYEDEVIMVKNTGLHLYGIDNVYFPDHFDLKNAFDQDESTFSILLSHIPESERFSSFGMELILSGDSHGGIFRLPYVGAVYDGGELLPDMNGKLTKGLYELDDQHIHVSGGLGNYPLPLRFWNRPEIAVIKLQPNQ